MASFNGIDLPTVEITPVSMEGLCEKFALAPMAMETMIEITVYLKREMEKVAALQDLDAVIRARIKDEYANMDEAARETRRTPVGMSTYNEGRESVALIDRDKTVEKLTTEQIRITYKPDVKALETILKPEEFERHVKRGRGAPFVTIRDLKSDDYEELDF